MQMPLGKHSIDLQSPGRLQVQSMKGGPWFMCLLGSIPLATYGPQANALSRREHPTNGSLHYSKQTGKGMTDGPVVAQTDRDGQRDVMTDTYV